MNFNKATKVLGIEKYAERIFKSNSHGELLHLEMYSVLAECYGKTDWFPLWFDEVVKWAEETWDRPESVFQHIDKIIKYQLNSARKMA